MQMKPPSQPAVPASAPFADRYFAFLGTPRMMDDGVARPPAGDRYIDLLREVHAAYRPRFDLSACLAGTQPGFKGQVWFWSDLHFFHANVIKYCDRPFETAEAMNDTMLRNCLARVEAEDILVFGGDITMSSVEATNELLCTIPGYKINVLGNHDIHKRRLLGLGVDETAACLDVVYEGRQLRLSHYPVSEPWLLPGETNVHGHIHNSALHPSVGDGSRHINMSVEGTGYAPMLLGQLLSRGHHSYL